MTDLIGAMTACALAAQVALLIPMVPGGVIDTRDFSEMPRWQFRTFNVFLVTLGLATIAAAWFVAQASSAAFVVSILIGALYCAVFALDLGQKFPVVKNQLPVQLILLEAVSLALAAVVVALGLLGLAHH